MSFNINKETENLNNKKHTHPNPQDKRSKNTGSDKKTSEEKKSTQTEFTPAQYTYFQDNKLCMHCRRSGHISKDCRTKSEDNVINLKKILAKISKSSSTEKLDTVIQALHISQDKGLEDMLKIEEKALYTSLKIHTLLIKIFNAKALIDSVTEVNCLD